MSAARLEYEPAPGAPNTGQIDAVMSTVSTGSSSVMRVCSSSLSGFSGCSPKWNRALRPADTYTAVSDR